MVFQDLLELYDNTFNENNGNFKDFAKEIVITVPQCTGAGALSIPYISFAPYFLIKLIQKH